MPDIFPNSFFQKAYILFLLWFIVPYIFKQNLIMNPEVSFSFFHLCPFLFFPPCKSYHLYESYLSECLWQYLEDFSSFFFPSSNNNHYHYSLLNSSKVLISFNLSQILSRFLPLFYIWTISFLSLFFSTSDNSSSFFFSL